MAIRLSRRKLASHYADSIITGQNKEKLLKQLAAYLVQNGRKSETNQLVDEIEYQLSLKGIVIATITSATPLNDLAKSKITKLVSEYTGASEVQICEKVDPKVMGGFRLNFTGTELDDTVAKKLLRLKANYKR